MKLRWNELGLKFIYKLKSNTIYIEFLNKLSKRENYNYKKKLKGHQVNWCQPEKPVLKMHERVGRNTGESIFVFSNTRRSYHHRLML